MTDTIDLGSYLARWDGRQWAVGKRRPSDPDRIDSPVYFSGRTITEAATKVREWAVGRVGQIPGLVVPPHWRKAYSDEMERQEEMFGDAARDEALDALDKSDAWWIALAVAEIKRMAKRRQELTSDDIWAALLAEPNEPRAMGAAFRQAKRDGLIVPTDYHIKSTRGVNHGRRIMVWRSRVVEQ